MKKKTNLFEKIKQFHVVDIPEISWWIDECDWPNFKDMFPDLFEDGNNPVKGERILNGKEWNDWIIGSVFGDYEGHVMDEECPDCGHLLVAPNEAEGEFKGKSPRFCSECEFVNDDLIAIEEEEEAESERARNAPSEPKIRLEGQTLEQFCNKYGFKYPEALKMNCIQCKRDITPSDFYRTKSMAIIIYSHTHTGCQNQPAHVSPQGEKRKEWKDLLGVFSGDNH